MVTALKNRYFIPGNLLYQIALFVCDVISMKINHRHYFQSDLRVLIANMPVFVY